MAEQGAEESSKVTLTAAQKQLLIYKKQQEYWQKHGARVRRRNRLTALAAGAFVITMFGYSIFSVTQKKTMEEIDERERIHIVRGPRTGANS